VKTLFGLDFLYNFKKAIYSSVIYTYLTSIFLIFMYNMSSVKAVDNVVGIALVMMVIIQLLSGGLGWGEEMASGIADQWRVMKVKPFSIILSKLLAHMTAIVAPITIAIAYRLEKVGAEAGVAIGVMLIAGFYTATLSMAIETRQQAHKGARQAIVAAAIAPMIIIAMQAIAQKDMTAIMLFIAACGALSILALLYTGTHMPQSD